MISEGMADEYFEWMYDLVCNDDAYTQRSTYHKLLRHLYNVEFTYILSRDGNRAADGISLRYRFGRECRYSVDTIAGYLDDDVPCSVLEMLVALSLRCEDDIMSSYSSGDRTGQWFWNMIVNMNLGSMNDDRYDPEYVDEVLDIFLNREYSPDGNGGLFHIEDCQYDLREIEIWYQLNLYLDDFVAK